MSISLSVSLPLCFFLLHVVPARAVAHADLLRREQKVSNLNNFANREQKVGEDKNRTVFYAGLEGAGHHFLETVLIHLRTKFNQGFPTAKVLPLEWDDVCKLHADDTNTYDKMDFSNIHGMATLYPQWSYPCFSGTHEDRKLKQHPRLDLMKAKADAAKVDFHVLLMYRPLEECLVADCEHRVLEDCEHQADTLVSNARFLIDQVRQAFPDHGTVHCWRFGQLGSMKSAMNTAYGESDGWSDDIMDALFGDYKNKTKKVYEDDRVVQRAVDKHWWEWDMVSEAEVSSVPDKYKDMLAQPDKDFQELCGWAR